MSLDNIKFSSLSHEKDHIDIIRNSNVGHLSHQKDHNDVITQYKVWAPVT